MLQHQRDWLFGLQMNSFPRPRRKNDGLLLYHPFFAARERGGSSAVNGEDVPSAQRWIERSGPAARPRKRGRSEGNNFLAEFWSREMIKIHCRIDTSRDR